MRHRIAPIVTAAAMVAAVFAPTAQAQTGSLDLTTGSLGTTTSPSSPETKKAALEAYENLDTDAARAADPAGFDRRLAKLSSSQAMTEFLDRYSIDPSGELKRLAALMDEQGIDSFVAKTAGKHIIPNTGPQGGLQLVDELPAPGTPGDFHPSATCWKSYVGIGAFTWVTGFYCSWTGVLSFPCLWIASIAGDNINWDRYC